MRHALVIVIAMLAACSREAAPPANPADAAHAQAATSANQKQQELWEEVAKAGPPPGVDKLLVEAPVTTRKPVVIADEAPAARAAPANLKALDASRTAALVVVEMPADLPEFSGTARVIESRPDVQALRLQLGEKQLLTVQARVRNAPFRAEKGEALQVAMRLGDPFARNDVLAIRGKNDDLAYALVGGQSPVRIEVPMYRLSAMQSDAKGNAPAVVVSMGAERQTLQAGSQGNFKGGLTVKVLSSVAVPPEGANAVPEPYRLEILAWRTGDRPAAAAP